ncbi:DciA family protein [Pseudoalteromonas sp. SSDWG2]|uniref:DciA family protein n=1 Tax=Pseudoalteromonas sp. SSDWG2 TaxID=3139391 RepID=UPI003BAA2A2F
MAKDRYAPKQLTDVLGKLNPRIGSRIAGYGAKTQALASQQQILHDAVGENLAKKCSVANVRDGTLVIEAISATVAMKLNYIKMDILSAFRQSGMADLCQVKINTSPNAAQRTSTQLKAQTKEPSSTASSRNMSEQTADYLEHIAQNAPPSLQQKLIRLAQHGRQKK